MLYTKEISCGSDRAIRGYFRVFSEMLLQSRSIVCLILIATLLASDFRQTIRIKDLHLTMQGCRIKDDLILILVI